MFARSTKTAMEFFGSELHDEGMSRFKDGRFVNYKAEDGLHNNGVFAIREDSRSTFG